jgi:two-component system sensor histidine kinase UhpB
MTGVKKEDMLGKGDYAYAVPFYGTPRPLAIDLVLEWDTERVRQYDFVKQEGGTLLAATYVPMTYEGKGAYLSAKASPLFDAEGHVIGAIESIRDITGQKRIEKDLRESEERYRTAIENSNDGVVITREGLLVYVNRRLLEMSGYGKAEEVLGKHVGDLIHPEHRKRVVEMNIKRQTGEVLPSKNEFVGVRSDGSLIHLESSSSTITYGGEPAVLGYLRDITDRKQAEGQLRDSHERLRALTARLQAIREEERAKVAREIHDELGQALTCMKIDLWQIREESSLDRVDKDGVLLKIESLLGFIDATVDTVRRIASDLRPSILDDLGLVPAIEWQLQDFQKRTGIICEFRKPRSLVVDKDCSSALFSVLQESLTNIARHSEGEKVEITLTKTKEELHLIIRDNGKGIQESDARSNASLGILGMRERVRPFDGMIRITGKPGKGTMVVVNIPLPRPNTKNPEGT